MSTTHVILATADDDFGHVATGKAKAEAQTLANTEGKTVTIRHPVTDKVLGKVKPTKGKAKAKAKTTKGKAKAAPKAKATKGNGKPKVKAPRGMVVEILKAASRAKGVSPAELNALTKWKGAPWKWLFSNPKKNGYCDRWNYKFAVLQTDEGVRYKVVAR